MRKPNWLNVLNFGADLPSGKSVPTLIDLLELCVGISKLNSIKGNKKVK